MWTPLGVPVEVEVVVEVEPPDGEEDEVMVEAEPPDGEEDASTTPLFRLAGDVSSFVSSSLQRRDSSRCLCCICSDI